MDVHYTSVCKIVYLNREDIEVIERHFVAHSILFLKHHLSMEEMSLSHSF